MTYKELLQDLKSLGSEQTRKTCKRHGIQGEIYGVSYAELGKLKKKIKLDHELAIQLWKSGNHDARVIAILLEHRVAEGKEGQVRHAVVFQEDRRLDLGKYPVESGGAALAAS